MTRCYKPSLSARKYKHKADNAAQFWGYAIVPKAATAARKAKVDPKAVPVDRGAGNRYCVKDCNWSCYLDNYPALTKKFGKPGTKMAKKQAEAHYIAQGKKA